MLQPLEGNKEVYCVSKEKKKRTHILGQLSKKNYLLKVKVLVNYFLSEANFKTSVLKENQGDVLFLFFLFASK